MTPESKEIPIPEEFEEWISQWLRDNVVTKADEHEDIDVTLDRHNAKTTWARAIALAAYRHLSPRLSSTPSLRWVDATERLPEFKKTIHLKNICPDGQIIIDHAELNTFQSPVPYFTGTSRMYTIGDPGDILLWLDESPASSTRGSGEGGWISVEDDLPEIRLRVLITDGDTVVGGVCFYRNGDLKWFSDFSTDVKANITYWMPFPPLPASPVKEGGAADNVDQK
jgi:hypothetical protein